MDKTEQLQNFDFDSLIERNKKSVYKIAYLYCKNKYDADDIFQEVFFRYYKAKIEFNDLEHEKAWFIRVTVNCCKSLLNSAWFKRTTALEEDFFFEHKEVSILYESLLKLPSNYRTVVYLYYYEGYSVDEISNIISKNSSTLRTWLQRAREALKKSLEKENVLWMKS